MATKKLDVFISSDIEEFKRKRIELAKAINKIRFLEAILLEKRGADPDSVIQASLRTARECDIYLGIFGKSYSDTTIREFQEAVKNRKACLTYVKNMKTRDAKLAEFIENELSKEFKYHKFKGNKDLLKQVKRDLDLLLIRVLTAGLEKIQESKNEALMIEKKTSQTVQYMNLEAIPLTARHRDLINEALASFQTANYMQTIIISSIAIELALRDAVEKLGPDASKLMDKKPLGQLVEYLLDKEVIRRSDVPELNEIRYIRNSILHEGRLPTKSSAEWALHWTKQFIEKLSEA